MRLQELFDFKAGVATTIRYKLESKRMIPYPYQDIGTKKVSPTIVMAFCLRCEDEIHNVLISVRQRASTAEKDYRIWCADTFLEGRAKGGHTAAFDRCTSAASGLPSSTEIAERMLSQCGLLPASSHCEFWLLWRKKPKQLCAHTQAVLANHFDRDMAVEMETALDVLLGNGTTPAAPEEMLEPSHLKELLFRTPVLIEGDRGSGKTTEAFRFAREGGFPLVLVQGHEGIEAVDLLGHLVIQGAGSTVWKDGPVTQAFRKASKGEKVCLLLDELLRIPQRQLSVLLGALTKIDGKYHLRTGRIVNVEDGIAEEELLSCDAESLAVVATTNVGAEYAIDSADPALADRFVPIRKDTTAESLREVLTSLVASRGFNSSVVETLVTFFEHAQKLKQGGLIAKSPNTRNFVRAIELADSSKAIASKLELQSLLWVERDPDGFPVKEQIAAVKKLLARTFGTSS